MTYLSKKTLTSQQFELFAEYIYEKCAIKLVPQKKIMLSSRLNRRLRALQMTSFSKYYDYVTSQEGEEQELVLLINEVSTNKTDFFREPGHFDYLVNSVLPAFVKRNKGRATPFRVWSAGCSSGEEPYTIAMVLAEYQKSHPEFDFSIIASDISTKVLSIATSGIYHDDRLGPVSSYLRTRYMMKGRGSQKGYHRIVPELRQKINFVRFNFLSNDFRMSSAPLDLIFCRNVIIYFDRVTQMRLFQKFYHQIRSGGHIFIGHSETMPGMEGQLARVSAAAYQKVRG